MEAEGVEVEGVIEMTVEEIKEETVAVLEIGASNATRVDISQETVVRPIDATNVTKLVILQGIVLSKVMVVAIVEEEVVTQTHLAIIATRLDTLPGTVHHPKVQLLATLVAKLVIWLVTVTVMIARVGMKIRERERKRKVSGA